MIEVGYNQTHTSKNTIVYICMPSSNKDVRCCHTNINDCFFNGAFIGYILLLSYGSFLKLKVQKFEYGEVYNGKKIFVVGGERGGKKGK